MDKELLYRFFNGETSVEEEQRLLDEIDRNPESRRELLVRGCSCSAGPVVCSAMPPWCS